jgi:ABC-type branched-subunit amino acid transport system substrate-binding protein
MRRRTIRRLVVPALLAGLVVAAALASRSEARSVRMPRIASSRLIVPRGRPLEIAFVGSSDFPAFTRSFHDAIEMAIEEHPTVRGFSVEVVESGPPCFSGTDPGAANVAAANAIVADPEIAGVLGHVCSAGFRAALPVYEQAGVVTISGSATAADLPGLGPTVFNRTAVPDPGFESWYPLVRTLPTDLAFQEDYRAEFGAAPADFSDLYFDGASLLLRRLRQVSRIDGAGRLTVDRAALATVVRNTRYFQGATCRVTFDAAGDRVVDLTRLAACAEG